MVTPINYTMNVLNPIESYMDGLKFGEGIHTDRLNREVFKNQEDRTQETFEIQKEDRNRAIYEQQARAAKAKSGEQALLNYYENLKSGTATPNQLREAMVNYPEITERFNAIGQSFSSERVSNEVTFGRQVLFGLKNKQFEAVYDLIDKRIQSAPSDDEREAYEEQLQMLETDPDALAMQLTMPMLTLDEDFDDFYDKHLGGDSGDDISKIRELKFRANQGGLVEGTPEYKEFMLRTSPDTSLTATTVIEDAEGSLATELAKGQGKRINASIQAGLNGSKRLRDLDILSELFEQFDTGASAKVKEFIGSYGLKTDDSSLIEAANAIVNRLVPTARQPGSGPMSDKDLELFKKTFPDLMNSPGGNDLILNTLMEISEYEIAEGIISGKISDWSFTEEEDRKELEEQGLILSPKKGRKAISELPKVIFANYYNKNNSDNNKELIEKKLNIYNQGRFGAGS